LKAATKAGLRVASAQKGLENQGNHWANSKGSESDAFTKASETIGTGGTVEQNSFFWTVKNACRPLARAASFASPKKARHRCLMHYTSSLFADPLN
jgi:hypothetical protein